MHRLFRSHRTGEITVQFVQPQSLEHADSRVNRRMRRTVRPPAIPPTVSHLLLQQVSRNGLETSIVKLEIREDGQPHPRNARLAPPHPFCPNAVIDAAVPLQPSIEKQLASLPRLLARRWQPEIPQKQHSVSSRSPLRRVKPTVRRLPASPSPLRILSRQKPRSPTIPRNPPPLPLNSARRSTNQIPQNLPSNSRIPLKKPLDHPISLRCHIHSHNFIHGDPQNLPNQQTEFYPVLDLLRTRSTRSNP